jgi:hypothetical protein
MNRRPHGPVSAWIRPRRATRVAALWVTVLGSTGPACVAIDGGAVEVSWSIRSFDGEATTCSGAEIRDVRVCWDPLGDGAPTGETCRADHRRRFPCTDESGVTGFELQPGVTAFWIEPVCMDGDPADPGTYQVPPPIVRTVEEGKIVSLDSLLLVVQPMDDGCTNAPCTCVRP